MNKTNRIREAKGRVSVATDAVRRAERALARANLALQQAQRRHRWAEVDLNRLQENA